MTFKPIILIDFDGVLHSYTSGWQGQPGKGDDVLNGHDIIVDQPTHGAVQWLWSLITSGEVRPMIYSSRSRFPEGVLAMKEWLIAHGLPAMVADDLEFPTQKPAAFLTIDDRAICFTGVWPSVEEMKAFKPWNKREPQLTRAQQQIVDMVAALPRPPYVDLLKPRVKTDGAIALVLRATLSVEMQISEVDTLHRSAGDLVKHRHANAVQTIKRQIRMEQPRIPFVRFVERGRMNTNTVVLHFDEAPSDGELEAIKDLLRK